MCLAEASSPVLAAGAVEAGGIEAIGNSGAARFRGPKEFG